MDESYQSDIPGRPGSRFVINLMRPPIGKVPLNELHSSPCTGAESDKDQTSECATTDEEMRSRRLPEELSVMFVDDDPILRKLFSRMVKKVAPGWTIREAADGETAIRLAGNETFDLIFMDQYMASMEKGLLGTETTAVLRSNGFTGRLCGLSANDKELEFLEAGADVFTQKPFPCDPKAMTQELLRILYQDRDD